MIIFRVILKVGYNEAWFEFESAEDACAFAKNALVHMADSEDQKRKTYISMQAVDKSLEDKEEE